MAEKTAFAYVLTQPFRPGSWAPPCGDRGLLHLRRMIPSNRLSIFTVEGEAVEILGVTRGILTLTDDRRPRKALFVHHGRRIPATVIGQCRLVVLELAGWPGL